MLPWAYGGNAALVVSIEIENPFKVLFKKNLCHIKYCTCLRYKTSSLVYV